MAATYSSLWSVFSVCDEDLDNLWLLLSFERLIDLVLKQVDHLSRERNFALISNC